MRTRCLNPSTAVQRWARLAGARTAIVADGRTLTFADLDRTVDALVLELVAGGLRRGDRVAYLGLNSALFLQTLLASTRIGAVFVPVNFRLTAAEVEVILTDAGCRVAVVQDGHPVPANGAVRCLGESGLDLDRPVSGDAVADAVGSDTLGVETSGPGPDDPAIVMYTSGTTGRPRGVVLSYANLWWNQINVADALPADAYRACLAAAPLFHIGGLNAFALGTLVRGGTVVVHRGFDPAACLHDIETRRITSTFMVPTMFDAMHRDTARTRTDLTSLTSAVVAGAPVPPGLVLAWADDGLALQQAWGLTETAPFASYLPPAFVRTHPDSAGFAMPYSELAVRTADGEVVTEPGVEGELCVRGPQVTAGYWRDPVATAAVIDDAGWFRTGDLGRLDRSGHCYVLDRIKDLIISGGENISPAEVERVLVDHPAVTDVAVVDVPHERWGQTVVAAVTGAAGRTPTLHELRDFAGSRLAGYKLPTLVVHVETVPRNGSGKIDRSDVRALVRSLQAADGA